MNSDCYGRGDHRFSHNSPRPPVPGGETDVPQSSFRHSRGGTSPSLTPRRSALGDGEAQLGFEPEGSCGGPSYLEPGHSPPACLRWARNLHELLDDEEGVELFKKYLESEGQHHADTLNFWFACEGLKKQQDPNKANQIIKAIYKCFFLKSLQAVPDDLKKEVNRRFKEGKELLTKDIYDNVQAEVERLINETTYPNFLQSELYVQHVQQVTHNGEMSSSGSSRDGGHSSFLPTLHEDTELKSIPLTQDMLLATERRRMQELKPKSEAFAGVYLQHAQLRFPHPAYSSYNPVSRQDSELQSLSTESDSMSFTDSSVDGRSVCYTRPKKNYTRHALLNRDPFSYHSVIPRTQRFQKEQLHSDPKVFAELLTGKLEAVLREQEIQEKLDRSLKEGETIVGEDASSALAPQALADAIRGKLKVDDDNDQAILDQHITRVWSDFTPTQSPGRSRPRSPERRHYKDSHHSSGAYPSCHPYSKPIHWPRSSRKDRDVFSTFSSDSGNVHDYPEGDYKQHMPKSKSMPDYQDAQGYTGYDSRFKSGRDVSRRSNSKKAVADLTDSGVSVVSDKIPTPHPNPQFNKERVLSWLTSSEKESSKHRNRTTATTSPVTLRHNRKLIGRSGSLERLAPLQPFTVDQGIPTLPAPNTASQLEEARRRLEEESRRTSRQRQTGMTHALIQPSNQSTMRSKGGRGRPQDTVDYTTVVFTFCDEPVPYRTKISGKCITLRQFKDVLPKKGSYRFYFKTECDDVPTKVIQEEITDDHEIVPLWDGKIMAQVKPIE